MVKSQVKHLPKSTVEFEISIPWTEIKEIYNQVLADVKAKSQVPGFRKGKAPKELVEKNVKKSLIYEEVIKQIIPKAYQEALQEHKLIPVISPKVEIVKAKENEDWLIKALVALKPAINLKNYKDKIKNLKTSKVKIWTPGAADKKDSETKKLTLEEIVGALLEEIEVELSDLLITQEANRLLADLIDQTKQLGLTVEQYLMAKNKTSEQLKAEYAKQAARNLSLEFALSEIADKENIITTKEDLDTLISKVDKPEERSRLQKDSYYLAHLIRQQKTLDFLGAL